MSPGQSVDVAIALQHDLLRCERLGNALIVTPQGDSAGFGRTTLELELARIRRLLADHAIQSVVIDLGSAPYCGVTLIGQFLEWREVLGTRGPLVFCDPSSDMQAILTRIDGANSCPIYRSRGEAVRTVVRRSLRDRLRVTRRVWWPLAAVVAVAAVWWTATHTLLLAPLVGTPESRCYGEALDAYHDALRMADARAPHRDWKRASQQIDERLHPLIAGRREARPDSEAQLALLQAIQHVWQQTRSTQRPTEEQLASMRESLQSARRAIEAETGLVLPAPQEHVELKAARPLTRPLGID